MDTLDPERRKILMSHIGGKNTRPELVVRSLAHRLGYRFRLHRRDLPGTPDLVFPSRHAIIFVHGCFWHGHNCRKGKLPKTNLPFWEKKISDNRARDERNLQELNLLGWKTLIVWECELRKTDNLISKIVRFLN